MDSTLFTRCFRCMEDMGSDSLCPHCGYDNSHGNPQPYALPAGTILRGKYVLGLPLGQGGFGITYIGWEVAAGRKVAIKEYFPSGQVGRSQEKGKTQLIWYSTEEARYARGDGLDAFLREARKMYKVSRIPQVVNVLEVFEENATAYIVMDFIQGENLKDRVKRTGPMSWKEAKEIFLPVAEAMAKVHREGLIHRDISPDNLIIQPDGTVRILDLGAAKDLSISTGASSMQVAKSGFSPLEQYTQQGGSGTWTDVYALAATMYYAITGKLPPSAVDRLAEDTLQWEDPHLAALPENVAVAMQMAMVLNRNNRTQTMEDFIEGLGGKQEPETNTAQGSDTPQADQEPREKAVLPKPVDQKKASKKKIPKWCAAAVLGLCMAVFGWAFAYNQTTDTQTASSPEDSRVTVASPSESSQPAQSSIKNDYGFDEETLALIDAGTKDVYVYSDGSFVELYFNKKDQERCRVFFDKDENVKLVCAADYDKNGNMTEHRVYDGDQKLMWKDTWAYNKNGDVTEQHYVDGNNRVQRYILRKYDSKGRQVSGICKNTSNEVIWESSFTHDMKEGKTHSMVTVKYWDGTSRWEDLDGDGNLIQTALKDAQGNLTGFYQYKYNSSGQEIQCIGYNGNREIDCQWEYTYEGELMTKESYESYGDDPYSIVTLYTYGARDIRFTETKIFSSGGEFVDEYMTGIAGNPLYRYSTYGSGDHMSLDLYFYDCFGNVTHSESYDKTGRRFATEDTTYDIYGNVTVRTRTSDSYDGGYTVTEYDGSYNILSQKTYDKNGKLISGD